METCRESPNISIDLLNKWVSLYHYNLIRRMFYLNTTFMIIHVKIFNIPLLIKKIFLVKITRFHLIYHLI